LEGDTIGNHDRAIKLYHGTDCLDIEEFKIIERDKSQPDFGSGVYFTSNLLQAEEWACRNGKEGVVYECSIDLCAFKTLSLGNPENEDLYYTLYLCRLGLEDIAAETIEGFDDSDIIFGCLLRKPKPFLKNAQLFNEGDLTFQAFKKRTKLFGEEMNQYCMKSASVLDVINRSPWKYHIVSNTNGNYLITETIDIPAPV